MPSPISNIELSLLLNIEGFSGGIKSALQILNIFQNKSRDALNLPPIKLDFSDIDKLTAENSKLQDSLRKSTLEENKLESQHKETANASKSLTNAENNLESQINQTTAAKAKSAAVTVTLSKGFESLALRMQTLQGLYSILSSSINSFIQESNKQEVSNAKLLNGLKNNNEGMESFIKLSKQAESLQKITVFPDEEIMSAQSMLTTFMKSSEEIEILTPRILDLAAAFDQSSEGGKSLQEVAVMLGKVNEETIGTLRRVGVAFSKEQEEKLKSLQGTEQAIYLSEILDQNFKNMAVTIGSTSAGKMKIFANQIGELKESFGDLIKSAISPAIPALNLLVDKLKNAPEPLQKVILGVAALGAAFILFNSQLGPIPYIAIALFTALSALPPELSSVASATVALTAAVFLLSAAFGALSVSSGGITIAIGLLATAIAKLALNSADSVSAVGSLSEKFDELNNQYSQSADGLNKLNELQSLHNNITSLSADQKQRYNSLISELTQLYPNLISSIDESSGAYSVNADTISEVIDQEQELQKLRSEQAMLEAVKSVNQITAEYQEQIEKYDELKIKVDNYNSALAELNSLLAQGKISSSEYDMSKNILNNQFAGVKKEFLESSQAVNSLKGKLNEVMIEASRFPEFNNNLSLINQNFSDSDKTAKLLRESLSKINSDNALNSLLNQSKELSKELSLNKSLISEINKSIVNSGNPSALKPSGQGQGFRLAPEPITKIWNDILRDVKQAEDQYNLDSVKSDGSFDKRFKTPFDRAGAILKSLDERFQFQTKLNNNLVDRAQLIEELNNEITTLLTALDSDSKESGLSELQIIEKINNLKEKQLSIINDINKEQEEINKKQTEQNKRNYDAESEITKLKIDSLNNEFEKKRQTAAFEFSQSQLKVNNLNIDPDIKSQYLKQLKINFDLDIQSINLDEKNEKIKKDIAKIKSTLGWEIASSASESLISAFSSSFKNKISSILKNSLFGGEANSILQQFLLDFSNRFVDILTEKIINSAIGFLLNLFLSSASGGMSSAIGAIPFASGGAVPGTGNSDNVPILATPGEFILNKKSVSNLISKFGSGFLAWLNDGGQSNSLAFADGGAVPNIIQRNYISSTSQNANNKIDVKLDIPDIKLKGKDIFLSWKKSNDTNDKRKF